MSHWCSYHILTSSVIYYTESDARQHGIYLFYIIRKSLFYFKIFEHNEKAGLLPRLCSTLVQSLNFPFFPPHIRAEPGRAKEESRIICVRMFRTPPFPPPPPPQIGGKPYLEEFSRFGLRRDFLNGNIQAKILYSDWLKTCQLIPNQWKFTSATLNHNRFVFFITISKITKEIFAKICWQMKAPTRNWKCTRCIMQMSYLYASDFPFKNFCKIAQDTKTIQKKKNVWEKSNDAYSLSIRVQTAINHISIFTFLCFYNNINVKVNVFFQSELKLALRDTFTRAWWDLVSFDWFVLSIRMQLILESSFARSGSAPIWFVKKGEFRD